MSSNGRGTSAHIDGQHSRIALFDGPGSPPSRAAAGAGVAKARAGRHAAVPAQDGAASAELAARLFREAAARAAATAAASTAAYDENAGLAERAVG